MAGKWETCCDHQCQMQFWLPKGLYHEALARRGPNGVQFYCPRGHNQWYVESEAPIDKIRRERDHLTQQLAQREDVIRQERDAHGHTKRQLAGRKGVVTLLKRRASRGKCPCCSQDFQDLKAHMMNRHPNFAA